MPVSEDIFSMYLTHLPNDEIKVLLKECCPHGYTPLMNRIKVCNINGVKPFFNSIPKELNEEIFNFKAPGWTMTHGEKLLWMAEDDCLEDTPVTGYLEQNFNLEHSDTYRFIDKEQLKADLITMVENREKNTCDKRERFLKFHGQFPEAVLGIEVDSRPIVYTTAFKKLMLKHHPDKNQNVDNGMSARITAAKKFICDIGARKKNLK